MNDSAHLVFGAAPVIASGEVSPAPHDYLAGTQRRMVDIPRHVAFLLDPAETRAAHDELARGLEREGIRVSYTASHPPPRPGYSVDLLLTLERLIHPRVRGRLSQRAIPHMAPTSEQPEQVDLWIDFCGARTPAQKPCLAVAFDGSCGEASAFGALFAGRMPVVTLQDADNRIVSRGVPCADNAGTVVEAFECVLARLADLVTSAVRGWSSITLAPTQPANPPRLRDAVAFERRALQHAILRRLYRLCCHSPHWRTCWRFVDGPDLWDTRTTAGSRWNVIPDPGFRFYADPFPFQHEGRTFVFVEDLDHRTNKGVISVIPFDANGPCGEARPVLEEPWHLSFPYVFAEDGQVWMIPEASASNRITLYRADPFPHRWVPEAVLVRDIQASDATIVRHNGRLWMFAATRSQAGSWSDTLSLFVADDLRGPWLAHPGNPVLVDQASARSAGAFLHRNGRLWRPAQDCTGGYGTGIALTEVTRLDLEGFEQRTHCILKADPAWPGRRFHTLNRAGNLECIDGSAHSFKSATLRRLRGQP